MIEESSNYDSKLYKQDLKIYLEAIKKKDFKTANIISNRIMTNAWVSDTQLYGITGFFLRRLALDAHGEFNVNNSAGVESIINQTSSFADNVLSQVSSDKNDLNKLWISFHRAIEKSRKVTLPDDEKSSYTDNTKYTSKTVQKVTKLLFSSKDFLTYGSNNIIKGVLNEISRVSRTHGVNPQDLQLSSILVMIDRIDEYVGTTATDKEDFEKRISNEVIPHIKKLEELHGNGMHEEQVNDLLWKLIKEWREYYIRFLEPSKQPIQSKIPIIEGRIKDELVKELAEGIEKEVIGE